jgi:glycosyltransferase involved in cell wall biosynthesis
MSESVSQPKVAILMATYNGEKYLAQQLASLDDQAHQNWCLVVSDDGSSDSTLAILQSFRAKWGEARMQIRTGPKQGVCQNFLAMATDASIQADYFAFCDQDDVWLPSKLVAAVAHLESEQLGRPHLYCSRTAYVKDNLKIYGHSPAFAFPTSFRNALVQSIAGGNTMVFNRAAKKLLEQAAVVNAVLHDWWLYQLVTGAGGVVFLDPQAHILYRQHPKSLVGSGASIFSKLCRIWMVFRGDFRLYSEASIKALNQARHCLDDGSIRILDLFIRMRQAPKIWQRFRLLEVCGLYRQTWRGTLSLILAATFNKI